MSSRALRRLQQEATVIKVSAGGGVAPDLSSEEGEERPGFAGRSKSKGKAAATVNPFAMLDGDEELEHESDRDGDAEEEMEEGNKSHDQPSPSRVRPSSRKKKKRKKSKQHQRDDLETPDGIDDVQDVDAAIKEVNALLGEVEPPGGEVPSGATATTVPTSRSLLCVERRFLNADNEMRRIFGSRVVRGEAGRQRAHRRVHHRQSLFATPKDSWPKMDRTGLTMELAESKDGCQHFNFKHSADYQKVQFQFLQAVETFDPNAIGAVLHAHPYHIDSLLQLSEVCKMSEDLQMATELLERALYCFESSFHTLFNIAHGNCRLNYCQAENRPFFIALFRHLYYIGRKGCHRTALEFCKLLLGLDPEGDPLCVLLMIDYYALRADEPGYLLSLFESWEAKRNLSQLPNFALSIPLALFNASRQADSADTHASASNGPVHSPDSRLAESNSKLQEALIMFPNVLLPLMEKCQVTLDPVVIKHAYFNTWNLNRDPKGLQLLLKLFIERSHSLWKEPEVLTWLEQNARQVVARVDAKDPLVEDCRAKREVRYVGTPRNISRHVVMSDFDDVTATLPRELCESGIMMYDPLPPLDSVSSYATPALTAQSGDPENPLLLFLRSMLPTFENMAEEPLGAGGLPLPPRQRLQAQYAAQQRQRQAAARAQGQGGQEPVAEGAVGGAEGLPPRPLDVQASLNELLGMLQRVLDFLPGRGGGEGEESDGYDSTTSSGRAEDT